MISKLSMLAMAGAASVTALGAAAQAQTAGPYLQPGVTQPGSTQQGLSQTCAFTTGPRAGQIIHYPGSASVPVGSQCADLQGSSGQAVVPGTARQESPGRYYSYRGYYTSPGAPSAWGPPANLGQGFSRTCSFTSGPRAGTTVDFSNTLGAQPVAIGQPCAVGASRGVAVAPGM